MKLKHDVVGVGVASSIWYAIGIAETIYLSYGHSMVVTSLTDGKHMTGSYHYRGLAVDIHSRDLSPEDQAKILSRLIAILDPMGFDVIVETDHIHIEYDPKGSENSMSRVD